MGFSAVYCTACYLLLFVPAMAASTLQSRARYCKGRKCIFSLFIDTFRQHCKIVVIHPQQPLCHCRAPCQGCNAADADLWYTLPDVLDEIVATQCAARMVIGAFTASSFFQNQPLKLLADHTVPRGGIQRTQDLSLSTSAYFRPLLSGFSRQKSSSFQSEVESNFSLTVLISLTSTVSVVKRIVSAGTP